MEGDIGSVSSAILTSNAEGIDFGGAKVGDLLVQSVKITNESEQDAEILKTSADPAAFSPGEILPCVRPWETVSLNVMFAPSDAGTFKGVLKIESESAGESNPTLEITLKGDGLR